MIELSSQGSSRAACRALDRAAIETFGMPSLLLMEHAALGASLLALQALAELGCEASEARVLVLCGPGNNGGDGFAMARHLHNAGTTPQVWDLVEAVRQPTTGDRACQRTMVERLAIPVLDTHPELPRAVLPRTSRPPDLVVDAVFGTGLDRAPSGHYGAAIEWLVESGMPTLAVDLPSGLDADRGVPLGATVRARWTATFGLIKQGFLTPGASDFTGRILCSHRGAPCLAAARRAGLPAVAGTLAPAEGWLSAASPGRNTGP